MEGANSGPAKDLGAPSDGKPRPAVSDRKRIDWPHVRGIEGWSAIAIGTFFGSGLLPKAPGTWGTLAAMPLAYAVAPWSLEAKLALWTALFLAGIWAGKKFQDLFGIADNQHIVMDEVVGLGIAALLLAQDSPPWQWAAAFVLFRFCDIVKLPPVGALDRWSKTAAGRKGGKNAPWVGGFGVMADDLVAGAQAWVVLEVLRRGFDL